MDERGSRDLGQPARTSAPHGSRPGAAAAQRDETLHLGYGERLRGLKRVAGRENATRNHGDGKQRPEFARRPGPAPRVLQDRTSCARHKGKRDEESSVIGRVPLPVNIITPRNCRTPV